MFSRDELFYVYCSLNNLAMLKMAHDLDVQLKSPTWIAHEYNIDGGSWDLLLDILINFFELVDWYYPYSDEKEEISYWLNLIGRQYDETYGLIVILDDRIKPFESLCVGGWVTRHGYYSAFGEINHIDRGIVFYFDEEEGPVDYADVLTSIIHVFQESEGKKHEVAV